MSGIFLVLINAQRNKMDIRGEQCEVREQMNRYMHACIVYGQTLLLHDLLCALKIHRKLVSAMELTKLRSNLSFENNKIDLCLSNKYYDSNYIIDGFFDVNLDSNYNNNSSTYQIHVPL